MSYNYKKTYTPKNGFTPICTIGECSLKQLEFGILELARTGMVALERGRYTIDEDTKEKGEFDYGKNLH